MTDLFSRLKSADRPTVLYGTGNGADKAFEKLDREGISVSGVFASDGFVRKRFFHGFPVKSLDEILSEFAEPIIVMVFGSSRPETIENVIKIKQTHEFYCMHIPVVGDDFFDTTFARTHAEELTRVYDSLADEMSKKVFRDDILFSLTGDVDYLFDCESRREDDLKLLNLTNNEIYVDLGAYNGDTVISFAEFVGKYEKIYAFEPDKKNFEKLKKNTSNMKNIDLFNCAAGEKNGEMLLSASKGRGCACSQDGVPVAVQTVDSVLDGRECSFIKFDVEGLECQAIQGAKNTIEKYTPKMCISCYHRSSDLFEIPQLIRQINNSYRIYLRRNRCIPDWDMCYYFLGE